jgi:hypothetical protein
MAIAFGIISIVLGVIGGFMAGWVGAGIAAAFGGLAVFFCIRKNKQSEDQRKRFGSMVCGIIGIALAFLLQLGIMSFADKLKEEATKVGDVPYVVAGADGFKNLGFIGFMSSALKEKPADMSDSEFSKVLQDQMTKVTDSMQANK